MIIAITGGTGFIGRKLVSCHLARGDEVRVLSRRPPAQSGLPATVRHWPGDLAGSADLRPFVDAAEILYHCAGEIRNTDLMQAVHVGGTRSLIEAAAGRIGRWVQLSSVGAYGPVSEGSVTEDAPLKPVGAYELTKTESDRLVVEAAGRGAFSCAILRPSNVFAADMTNSSLFALIRMIDKGLFFFIGKPGASANYIHADCVVHALTACAVAPEAKGRIYNLSDHRTREEFMGTIADALGRPAPRLRFPEKPVRWAAGLFGGIPGFPLTESRITTSVNRSIYPIARIQQELGYAHVISMEAGLRQLVAAYRQRQAAHAS
jgi:nucleoside-diphosphate-sugar epimerase